MARINVLHLKANSNDAEVIVVDSGYEASTKLVGGYLEALGVDEGIVMYLNEEGKLNGLPTNFNLIRNGKVVDVIVGDVFFSSLDEEGDNASLTEEHIAKIEKMFLNRRNMVWE